MTESEQPMTTTVANRARIWALPNTSRVPRAYDSCLVNLLSIPASFSSFPRRPPSVGRQATMPATARAELAASSRNTSGTNRSCPIHMTRQLASPFPSEPKRRRRPKSDRSDSGSDETTMLSTRLATAE